MHRSFARSLLSRSRIFASVLTANRALLLILVLSVSAAPDIHAQDYVQVAPVPGAVRTRITVVNALLGATIGGARAWIRHRPIRRGLALGALGGLTTAGARQVVATRRDGAGIFGRVLHDVGLGLGSAASDSMLTIPFHVGPLVARWAPATRSWPSVRVNLTNLVYAGVAIAQIDGRVDWRSTLWSGAVTVLPGVNVSPDYPQAAPGTIALTDVSSLCGVSPSGASICRVDLAHESIHVLQLDMMHEWVGKDIEAALVRRLPGVRGISRWVEVGAVGPGTVAFLQARRPYHTRWIEYEAFWLTEGAGAPP